MTEYVKGKRLRLTKEFRVDGVLTNPDSVTLKIREPGVPQWNMEWGTDPIPTSDVEGQFYADWTFNVPGQNKIRWESAGVVAPEEIEIDIQESDFT